MKKESIYSRDVWLILIANYFYAGCGIAVNPIIAGFAESLGASAALMGMVGGMMNLCALACRPIAGNIADKVSKFRLTIVGASLMFAGCVICAAAQMPAMIVVGRIVTGIGFSFSSVCVSTWLSEMLPRNKVGAGMGMYGMFNALANALAPSISVTVWQHFGYRAALALAAVYAAILGIIVCFIQYKGEPTEEAKARKFSLKIVEWRIFPVACIIMLMAIPYFANGSFLVSYDAKRELGLTISLYFPVFAAALFVLRFALKDYFDRLPFRWLITGSIASSAVGLLLLTFMRSNVLLVLAALFMAGGYGLSCSICQSTSIMMAGKSGRAIANSTYYVGLDLGMMLGPVIGGMLYGYLPIEWFYPVLMVCVPAALAIAWGSKSCRRGAQQE